MQVHVMTHPKLLDKLNYKSKGEKQRKDKKLGYVFWLVALQG
jgi:hypothetical protein